MAAKKRTTKRTTKKASNSIVEPTPTTSSNGRRIAILVIVVLGIVILWRGGEEDPAQITGETPQMEVKEKDKKPGGEDGKTMDYDPNDRNKYVYDPSKDRNPSYTNQAGN